MVLATALRAAVSFSGSHRAAALSAVLFLLTAVWGPSAAVATHESICIRHEEEPPPVPFEPIELCGTTTITSDAPVWVGVRLTEPLTLGNPWFGGDDIEISGSGRFVGFALVQFPFVTNTDIYIGGRLPTSADARLFFERVQLFQDLHPTETSFEIPAGEYRLYLLPDEGPATLTLRLDELEGEIDLPAAHPAGYDLRFPQAELATPSPAAVHYSARAYGSLRSQGAIFHAAWFDSDVHAVSDLQSCFYDQTADLEPTEPATYGPGCAWWYTLSPVHSDYGPTGWNGGGWAPLSTEPGLNLIYSGYDTTVFFGPDPDPAGPYTAQMSLETAHIQGAIESMALFLSFD